MLKRLILIWLVAPLVLWDVCPFVPSAALTLCPRPLFAAQYLATAFNHGAGGPIITFDARSNGTVGVATSISWTHVAANNSFLYVSLYGQSTAPTGSSCTFNSVSMTQLATKVDLIPVYSVAAFGLYVTSGGSYSVSCLWPGQSGVLQGSATSWLGVSSSTPNRTPVTASASSGSPSVTVSNAQSGDMVVDTVQVYTNSTIAAGGGQTQQFEQAGVYSNGQSYGSSSKAAAGSTTMTWTSSSTYWEQIGVALVP